MRFEFAKEEERERVLTEVYGFLRKFSHIQCLLDQSEKVRTVIDDEVAARTVIV